METNNWNNIPDEIDKAIQGHLAGHSDDEEESRLLQWLQESEENREYYAYIAAVTAAGRALHDFEKRRDRMIIRLNQRIDSHEEPQTVMPRRKKRWYYAAGITGIIIGVIASLFLSNPETEIKETQYYSYSNTSSDVQSIVLQDNSKIWLRNGSTLKCSIDDKDMRSVTLSGAAYFDIMRDTLRPFIVNTNGIAIKVLGTKFSVETSPDDTKTKVVLESGSVRLQTPEGASLLRLQPNQSATFDSLTDDIVINSELATSYVTEHFNKVSIPNATLDEILHHVNFMFETELLPAAEYDRTKIYTFNYKRTDSLDTVINTIYALTGVQLKNI